MLRNCLLGEGLGWEVGFRAPLSCWVTLEVGVSAIVSQQMKAGPDQGLSVGHHPGSLGALWGAAHVSLRTSGAPSRHCCWCGQTEGGELASLRFGGAAECSRAGVVGWSGASSFRLPWAVLPGAGASGGRLPP